MKKDVFPGILGGVLRYIYAEAAYIRYSCIFNEFHTISTEKYMIGTLAFVLFTIVYCYLLAKHSCSISRSMIRLGISIVVLLLLLFISYKTGIVRALVSSITNMTSEIFDFDDEGVFFSFISIAREIAMSIIGMITALSCHSIKKLQSDMN